MPEGEQKGPPFPKKPKLSKAEMRAKQERQRAEKAAKSGQQPQKKVTPKTNNNAAQNPRKKRGGNAGDENEVQLFAHLQSYGDARSDKIRSFLDKHEIPAHVISLGLEYANFSIRGSNARCIALLNAFKKVVKEYSTPEDKSLHRDLEHYVRPFIDFLSLCRPKSVGMGNAITFFKQRITRTAEMEEEEAKEYLQNEIEEYISERIDVSKFIAERAITKIVDGDVVLTYASSTSVEASLKAAHDAKKTFRVIVVDSRPTDEGRNLLHSLTSYGLECCFITLNAVSFVMTEVTKVFLGAFAMLSNGNLISRAGNAGVAMMAHRFNIPVMVCCETYKFVERGQLDSIGFNELGNPDVLSQGAGVSLADWRTRTNLKLVNLNYDLTPVDFLSVIITEVGLIPPTSVPVILREQNSIEGEK